MSENTGHEIDTGIKPAKDATVITATADNAPIIEDGAFRERNDLVDVQIAEGVRSIGEAAFSGCKHLCRVHIPASVQTIGDSAFRGCSALEEVSIADGVQVICRGAFYTCAKLRHIRIPASVIEIGTHAFDDPYVEYAGTRAQWDKVKLHYKGDAFGIFGGTFSTPTINCSDGAVNWTKGSSLVGD